MTSCLYLISEGPDGPIKIGVSTKPRKRLKWLQTGNPRPLKLIAAWETSRVLAYAIEQEIMSDYEFFGDKVFREWVYLSEEDVLDSMNHFDKDPDFRRVI